LESSEVTEKYCLMKAWEDCKETVRDFEMYSKRLSDKRVINLFKDIAEEESLIANRFREMLDHYKEE
jgi:rubrerythrin